MENDNLLQTCVYRGSEFNMSVEHQSRGFYINFIIFCIFNILLSTLAIYLNSVTVLAYCSSTQLRKKLSFFLIMLLSLSDLASGISCFLTYTTVLVQAVVGELNCEIYVFTHLIIFAMLSVSLVNLTLLNTERYLGVVYPFYHKSKITRRRILVVAVVLWIFIVIPLTLLRLFMNGESRYLSTLLISLAIVAFIYMYISIFRTSRGVSIRSSPQTATTNSWIKLKELRLANSCAVVVCCTFICYIPFSITDCLQPSTIIMAISHWGKTFTLMSTSINSVVFLWRNTILRNEVRKVIFKGTER